MHKKLVKNDQNVEERMEKWLKRWGKDGKMIKTLGKEWKNDQNVGERMKKW